MVMHTPGPWYPGHMVDDECSCNCRSIVDEGYAGGIASVHIDNGIRSITDGGNDCPPLEEAKANARLIAAAPELLASLKEVVDWIDNWSPSFIVDDEWPETQERFLAAIAKAEGR